MALPVIRKQEGAFQAQYAELRERARSWPAAEAMITHIRPLLPKLRAELKGHPEILAELENCLSTQPRTAKASRKTALRPRRK